MDTGLSVSEIVLAVCGIALLAVGALLVIVPCALEAAYLGGRLRPAFRPPAQRYGAARFVIRGL